VSYCTVMLCFASCRSVWCQLAADLARKQGGARKGLERERKRGTLILLLLRSVCVRKKHKLKKADDIIFFILRLHQEEGVTQVGEEKKQVWCGKPSSLRNPKQTAQTNMFVLLRSLVETRWIGYLRARFSILEPCSLTHDFQRSLGK
jgi:hypothetical protein